jgi:hypothetical protein
MPANLFICSRHGQFICIKTMNECCIFLLLCFDFFSTIPFTYYKPDNNLRLVTLLSFHFSHCFTIYLWDKEIRHSLAYITDPPLSLCLLTDISSSDPLTVLRCNLQQPYPTWALNTISNYLPLSFYTHQTGFLWYI